MSSPRKTVTRHKTATIAMVAVLLISMIAYFASEYVLRKAMIKPIKREQVDFAKVLDWLPPKAKQELEYRARYLDLRQKYDAAVSNDDKLKTAYQFAIHTRSVDEHNEVLLPFINQPEKYAGTKDLYLAYMRMLYDPKNPKAISIQQYYDFMNTLQDPLDVFNAWNEGRNRIGRVGGRNSNHLIIEFLKPLLDKPLDFFTIREYSWCLDQLRGNAKRASNDAAARIANKRERDEDKELVGTMMALSIKADELRGKINDDKTNYNRNDYIRYLNSRKKYEDAPDGELKLKAGYELVRLIRKPQERMQQIQSLLKNPAYEGNPILIRIFALQADHLGKPGAVTPEDFVRFAARYSDPADSFSLWKEALNWLNSQKASSAQKMLLLHPLLNLKIKDLPFADYGTFYDQISRCAVYLNRQADFEKAVQMRDSLKAAEKPTLQEYLAEKQKTK